MTFLKRLFTLAVRLITIGLLVVGMSLLVGLLFSPLNAAGHGAASVSLWSLGLSVFWRLFVGLMPFLLMGWLLSFWMFGPVYQPVRHEER